MADRQRPFIGSVALDPEVDLERDGERFVLPDGAWGEARW